MHAGPVAIGGVGGSGTRVIATIIQQSGVFLGSDLPETMDTVWYAALFGRRDVLLEDNAELEYRANLFFRQMASPTPLTRDELAYVRAIGTAPRGFHSPEELALWTEGFIAHCETGTPADRWGWKVPYTFILVDRLLDWNRDLRYVHLARNGLDMAYTRNQKQLRAWGPVFLYRDIEIGPHDALKYWCGVQRRIDRIASQFHGRVFQLSFDRLVRDPVGELGRMFAFLGAALSDDDIRHHSRLIKVPDSLDRHKNFDLSVFDPEDVVYAQSKSQTGGGELPDVQ